MIILGIDLSLARTAAVAIPTDWDGQWQRVAEMSEGANLPRNATDLERVERVATIASRLVRFAQAHNAEQAWIESYAFGGSFMAHTLGELGGVVKHELARAGLELRTVNMGSARKLLLGKIPRGKGAAKDAVQRVLVAAGLPFRWKPDEFDALVVANWAMSELGGFCFAQEAA